MEEHLKNTCLYGIYYNPAEKHYAKECDVICDKCFRHNLDVSIGWETYDLCLKCAQSINKYLNKPVVDDDKKPEIQTKMMQEIFESNKVKRMMMQRQFIKKK